MTHDPNYATGLALYVRLYSAGRAEAGDSMTMEEVIGGLISVVASAIAQAPSAAHRAELIEATHRALDNRMISEPAASEAIN
jgi:hypothetical protein